MSYLVKVPNRLVDMDSRKRSACYPRGSLYPLSSADTTIVRRITKTCFRTCSRLLACSQAGLNLYAFPTISIRSKPTFVPLRYTLAGYRPSKTAHLTLSPSEYSSELSKPHTFQREVSHCPPTNVGVPPILVILALIIGAKLGGLLGVLISVPVVAAIMELVEDIERKKGIHS